MDQVVQTLHPAKAGSLCLSFLIGMEKGLSPANSHVATAGAALTSSKDTTSGPLMSFVKTHGHALGSFGCLHLCNR